MPRRPRTPDSEPPVVVANRRSCLAHFGETHQWVAELVGRERPLVDKYLQVGAAQAGDFGLKEWPWSLVERSAETHQRSMGLGTMGAVLDVLNDPELPRKGVPDGQPCPLRPTDWLGLTDWHETTVDFRMPSRALYRFLRLCVFDRVQKVAATNGFLKCVKVERPPTDETLDAQNQCGERRYQEHRRLEGKSIASIVPMTWGDDFDWVLDRIPPWRMRSTSKHRACVASLAEGIQHRNLDIHLIRGVRPAFGRSALPDSIIEFPAAVLRIEGDQLHFHCLAILIHRQPMSPPHCGPLSGTYEFERTRSCGGLSTD